MLHKIPVLFVLLALAAGAQDSARQRQRAIRDLAKGGSPNIPKIAPYVADPDLDVRVEAVKALVEIGTQYSLDPLVKALQDNDPEIQIRAADGLVNFYVPGYVRRGMTASLRRTGAQIRARFSDEDSPVVDPFIQVREDIAIALGKVARGSVSMESRANAARAAGILRARQALPDLLEALRSKDDAVLYEVLVAVRKINDRSAGPGIVFLIRDLNEKVQLAAIELCGLLRVKEAIPGLREAVLKPRGDRSRRAALSALAMIPDPANRSLYERFLSDPDPELRAGAAEGLARLRNPGDLGKVEQAYAEERQSAPKLALALAAVTLGRWTYDTGSPLRYLVDTLNSPRFRGVAEAYLIEVTREKGVREKVYPTLGDGTKDQKMLLAGVLAQTGDGDTIPLLDRLARDSDPAVAQEGVRAARNLKARLR